MHSIQCILSVRPRRIEIPCNGHNGKRINHAYTERARMHWKRIKTAVEPITHDHWTLGLWPSTLTGERQQRVTIDDELLTCELTCMRMIGKKIEYAYRLTGLLTAVCIQAGSIGSRYTWSCTERRLPIHILTEPGVWKHNVTLCFHTPDSVSMWIGNRLSVQNQPPRATQPGHPSVV